MEHDRRLHRALRAFDCRNDEHVVGVTGTLQPPELVHGHGARIDLRVAPFAAQLPVRIGQAELEWGEE